MKYKKVSSKVYKVNLENEESFFIEYDGEENELINFIFTEVLGKGKNMLSFNKNTLVSKFENIPSNNEEEI